MKRKKVVSLLALLTAVSMMSTSVLAAGPAGDSENVTDSAKESAGWQKDSNGWWYIDEYGEYPRNCIRYIHGDKYLFDSNGYMKTGWYNSNDNWYYFDETGAMVNDTVKEISGEKYRFTEKGNIMTNSVIDNTYYGASGAMDTTKGWKKVTNSHGRDIKWYYLDEDGKIDHTGWKVIDGSNYYFNEDNYIVQAEVVEDKYYVDGNGVYTSEPGWKYYKSSYYDDIVDKVKEHIEWCYVDSSGNANHKGWKKIDGNDYFFDNYCKLVLNNTTPDSNYFINSQGIWDTKQGWKHVHSDYDDDWYYVDADGMVVKDKWRKIDGDYYSFRENGIMKNNIVFEECYLNDAGQWKTSPGWKYKYMTQIELDAEWESWCYVDENGKGMSGGWKNIGGKEYCFDDYGEMYIACIKDDKFVNGSGEYDTTPGWKHYSITWTDKWFYVDENGRAMKNEWKEIDGVNYHFDYDGKMNKSTALDGYFISSTGKPDTTEGWKCLGTDEYKEWYYVDQSGKLVRDTWKDISGKYYRFNSLGKMYTDRIIDDRYVDENGVWRQ